MHEAKSRQISCASILDECLIGATPLRIYLIFSVIMEFFWLIDTIY